MADTGNPFHEPAGPALKLLAVEREPDPRTPGERPSRTVRAELASARKRPESPERSSERSLLTFHGSRITIGLRFSHGRREAKKAVSFRTFKCRTRIRSRQNLEACGSLPKTGDREVPKKGVAPCHQKDRQERRSSGGGRLWEST